MNAAPAQTTTTYRRRSDVRDNCHDCDSERSFDGYSTTHPTHDAYNNCSCDEYDDYDGGRDHHDNHSSGYIPSADAVTAAQQHPRHLNQPTSSKTHKTRYADAEFLGDEMGIRCDNNTSAKGSGEGPVRHGTITGKISRLSHSDVLRSARRRTQLSGQMTNGNTPKEEEFRELCNLAITLAQQQVHHPRDTATRLRPIPEH